MSRRRFAGVTGGMAAGLALSKATGMTVQAQETDATVALRHALLMLWTEHMQYTMQVVDAFFNNEEALDAYLDRLLRNQQDIGNALIPYYGEEAGKRQADLLTAHITLAVPVLEAARDNDQQALDAALKDWYANADENGIALSELNPDNWPPELLTNALRMHIDQTVDYSVLLLKKDYPAAIASYDTAHHHMLDLAEVMADGIISQFPEKF